MNGRSFLPQVLLIICGFLLFSENAFSQSSFFKKVREVGFSGDVIQTGDGGYIFAGNSRLNATEEYELFVVKLNSSGKIQWKKRIRGSEIRFTPPIIIQLQDGSYLLGAGKIGVTLVDILIVRLDRSGNILWKKVIDSGQYEYIRSIAKTADGGFVIAGGRADNQGIQGALVIKANQSGKIEWSRLYTDTIDEGTGIAQTSEGGFVLSSFLFDLKDFSIQMNLKKLNSTGEILWNKNIKGTIDVIPGSLTVTQHGSYVLSGTIIRNQSDGILIAFNSSGKLLWKKRYRFSDLGGSISNVTATSDGGLVAGGCVTATQGCESSFVMKVDRTGKLIWKKVLDLIAGGEDARLHATTDGGVIFTERTISSNRSNGDIFVLKLDSLGNGPACVTETDSSFEVRTVSLRISSATNSSTVLPVTVSSVPLRLSSWSKAFPNGCP